jgi:hypothetical protein
MLKVKIVANGQNWLREQNDIPIGATVTCSQIDRRRGCAWVFHPAKGHDVRVLSADIQSI